MPEHVADVPYLQEKKTVYTRREGLPADPVSAVAITADGTVWAATHYGLARLHDGRFETVGQDHAASSMALSTLWADGDDLWTGTSTGVSRLSLGEWRHFWWGEGAPTRAVRQIIKGRDGAVWVLTGLWVAPESTPDPIELWRYDGERWQSWAKGDRPPVLSLATGPAGTFAVCPDRILRLTGAGPEPYPLDLPAPLAGANLTCLACPPDGGLAAGTDRGLLLIAPDGPQEVLQGAQGLPAEQITGLACGPEGSLWVADHFGLARRKEGEWRYYPATRWMPASPGRVVVDAGGGAWIPTGQGLCHIEFVPMTLAEKAEYYHARMNERNRRHGWYCLVEQVEPHPDSPYIHEVTDNDGQHTGMQLAAQAFQYAVTGDPEVRRLAHESFLACLRLEQVTGKPGFMARCAFRYDERAHPSSGEWHPSPTMPGWFFKADTSSDEVDGHIFGYAVYHDLAADEDDKRECVAVVDRIVRAIIRDEWWLIDLDGKPTRWGKWSPIYFETPEGREARKLNSLEALNYCKVAYRLTGDDFFQQAYLDLINRLGYLRAVTEVTVACLPGGEPQFDDLLTFLTYYNICRYEDDPAYRHLLLGSLEQSWQAQRVEANPFFNFVYGALTGRPCDAERGVESLRSYSLDQRRFSVHNSHRADLKFMPGERGQIPVPLPPRERPGLDWESDVFTLDSGGDGRIEAYTHWWLLAYWLGRYHGFLG